MRNQVFFSRHCIFQNDGSGDTLTVDPIRDTETARFRDGRMTQQSLINFARRDLLSTAIDQLFDPANQSQVTILIQDSLIAGAKPAIRKRFRVRLRITLIAAEYIPSFD